MLLSSSPFSLLPFTPNLPPCYLPISLLGKTDQSAAGAAYDALVNQLLTLMDGLSEMGNLLVVGMTNRRELMDSALLRPGR